MRRSAAARPPAYATECDSTVGEDERSGDNLRRSTPSLNSDAARSSCCTRAARELVFAQNLDPVEFCSELTGSIVILSRIVLVTAAHRRAVSELTNSELAEGRIMNATAVEAITPQVNQPARWFTVRWCCCAPPMPDHRPMFACNGFEFCRARTGSGVSLK